MILEFLYIDIIGLEKILFGGCIGMCKYMDKYCLILKMRIIILK